MRFYQKLGWTLVSIGAAMFALERFGLSEFKTFAGKNAHLDGTMLSVLVLAPFGLILVGCATFLVGRLRR